MTERTMNGATKEYTFNDIPTALAELIIEVQRLKEAVKSRDAVLDEIKTALVSDRLNGKQAAKFLGIHVSTLIRKVDEGIVPAHDDGSGARYYLRKELEGYLLDNKIDKRVENR